MVTTKPDFLNQKFSKSRDLLYTPKPTSLVWRHTPHAASIIPLVDNSIIALNDLKKTKIAFTMLVLNYDISITKWGELMKLYTNIPYGKSFWIRIAITSNFINLVGGAFGW